MAFLGVSGLFFIATAAATIGWSASMSSMGGMSMPGGWTMSMAWIKMPGRTWPGAAASFVIMWTVMMVPMMPPSLVPVLWNYRRSLGRTSAVRRDLLTTLAGVGYFLVWSAFGAIEVAVRLGITRAARARVGTNHGHSAQE